MTTASLKDYIHYLKEHTLPPLSQIQIHQKLRSFLDEHPIYSYEDTSAHAFYEGERCFLSRDFSSAYEMQKEISHDDLGRFLFYRTAAYYLEELDDLPQASFYAKKALQAEPFDDHPWRAHLRLLAEQPEADEVEDFDADVEFVSVAPKELDDLTEMFQSDQEDDEEIQTILEENLHHDSSSSQDSREKAYPSSPYTPPSMEESSDYHLNQSFDRWQQNQQQAMDLYIKEEAECQEPIQALSFFHPQPFDLPLSPATPLDGFFLQWKGVGVAVNPPLGFLQALREKKGYLGQIQAVILTVRSPQHMQELQTIFNLNRELNNNREHKHFIDFYLPEADLQPFVKQLSFSNRQERESIHSLCFFHESEGVESLSLSSLLSCTYFSASSNSESIGLLFELREDPVGAPKKLAYLAGFPFEESLEETLQQADILCLGLGTPEAKDWRRESYASKALGVQGSKRLIDALQPSLALLMDLPNNQVVLSQSLVKQFKKDLPERTHLFLANDSFQIDLEQESFYQPGSTEKVPAGDLVLACEAKTLRYLSKNIFI